MPLARMVFCHAAMTLWRLPALLKHSALRRRQGSGGGPYDLKLYGSRRACLALALIASGLPCLGLGPTATAPASRSFAAGDKGRCAIAVPDGLAPTAAAQTAYHCSAAAMAQPRQRLASRGRPRPCHRRLRRGDKARPELRRCPQQPRRRLERKGRQRSRHRRLQRGDPREPALRACVLQPRQRVASQGR
jgi:hypothetical protein